MLAQHLSSKCLQHLLLSDIAYKVLPLLLVNDINKGSLRTELLGKASAYPVGTTGYNDYFIFKHTHLICFCGT